MEKRFAIFLNGEQISPSFETEAEASSWGSERYDVADDRITVDIADEDDVDIN